MSDFAEPDIVKKHKHKRRDKLSEPEDYKVILLNDDYTPMSFVVFILIEIFHKNPNEAEAIMLSVHEKGRGVAGVYTLDLAKSKINEVHTLAAKENFPLECTMEKA